MRRILAIGAFAVAFVAPLTGCGTSTTEAGTRSAASPTSPSASPTPNPSELLAAALARSDGQNVKITIEGGDAPISGGVDGTTGGVSVSGSSGGETIETLALRNDLYLKVAALNGKWLHMVVSKIPSTSAMLIFVDPLFGKRYLAAAADVKQGAPGNFSGTIDLTKVTGDPAATAKRIADHFATAAGAKATAVPFTATTDPQGRLATVDITFPGVDNGKDLTYGLKIVEYGAAVTIAVPSKSKLVEAPASSYNA